MATGSVESEGKGSQRREPQVAGGRSFPFTFFAIGLAIGLYAMLPAFAGPQVNVQRIKEVVDHVIPGLIVLALLTTAILTGARSAELMLVFGAVITLAGVWMLDTHVGLISQAVHHEVAWGAATFHSSTAVAVFGFGVAFVWRYRQALSRPGA